MKNIQKILIPIDFSETSEESLEIAQQLARTDTGSLLLLYVLPRPNLHDWTYTGMSALVFDDKQFDQNKQVVKEKLESKVRELSEANPSLNISFEISEEPDASDAILYIATSRQIDLIIMGSHGRRGLDRVLMGSVAESVLRQATCAVLILRKKKA